MNGIKKVVAYAAFACAAFAGTNGMDECGTGGGNVRSIVVARELVDGSGARGSKSVKPHAGSC
jgi:hypothetical protein